MFNAKIKRFLNAFPTSSSCHCAALAVPNANRSNWPQADGQTIATFWQTERERAAEEFHKICESATNYNGKYWSEMSADCLSLVQLHRRHSHSYSHSHSDCRAQQQKSRPKTKFMSALCVPSPIPSHSLICVPSPPVERKMSKLCNFVCK